VILTVDFDSPMPPYEQIRGQIASMVQIGVLAQGTRLPSIRQLANDLGVASGTVARAYRALEGDGVVATRGRHGTVVIQPPVEGEERKLQRSAAALAREAQRLGVSEDGAIAALRAAFSRPGAEGSRA
jgi:GntR family transcriptional regulator